MNFYLPKMITAFVIVLFLASCGNARAGGTSSEELTAFRETVDSFNSSIAALDSEINGIDASSENYASDITSKLSSLNSAFTDFAAVDFPAEFDYLEHLADEAADYMNSAVALYLQVFTDDSLTGDDIAARSEEASSAYESAFKRIKVIMTFLNGEADPNANMTSPESGTLSD